MRWTVLVATAALATTVAEAQGSFEGVVTYQMTTTNGKAMTFDYVSKGNKAMMQPHDSASSPMGFGAIIIDQDAKTRTMVMPARKVYVTMPINDNVAMHMDSTRTAKVVKVGSETVAGVACDDYTTSGSTGSDSGTVCIAHGMGNFALFGLGATGFMTQLEQRVQGLSSAASGGFFPLKWTGANNSMVALKVEQKRVDAAMFAPPAGYTQMQIPAGAASRMNNP
jgi:Domain of unknown function (DUF4412)